MFGHRFFLIAVILGSLFIAPSSRADKTNTYEDMSYQDLNALFARLIHRDKIIQRLQAGENINSYDFPRMDSAIVKKYIACYPGKSYFKNDTRAADFFETTTIPGEVTLLEDRYLLAVSYRRHETMVKSYFIFDLQKKETVLGLLNYTKKELEPFVDVYIAPTASSQLVGKSMEIIVQKVRDYMVIYEQYTPYERFPPFTLYTSRCLE